jgi:hypothetical protein
MSRHDRRHRPARSLISVYGEHAIAMAQMAASKARGANLKKTTQYWLKIIAAIKAIQAPAS